MRIVVGLFAGQSPDPVRDTLRDLGAATIQGPDQNLPDVLVATFPDAAPEASPTPGAGDATPTPDAPGMWDLPGIPEQPVWGDPGLPASPGEAPATPQGSDDLIDQVRAIPGVRYAQRDTMQTILD